MSADEPLEYDPLFGLVTGYIRVYLRGFVPVTPLIGSISACVQERIHELRSRGYNPNMILATPYMMALMFAGLGEPSPPSERTGVYMGCQVYWSPLVGAKELWIFDSKHAQVHPGAAAHIAEIE